MDDELVILLMWGVEMLKKEKAVQVIETMIASSGRQLEKVKLVSSCWVVKWVISVLLEFFVYLLIQLVFGGRVEVLISVTNLDDVGILCPQGMSDGRKEFELAAQWYRKEGKEWLKFVTR